MLTPQFSRLCPLFYADSPLYVGPEVGSEHVVSQVDYSERQLSRSDNHNLARVVGCSGHKDFFLLHGLCFEIKSV